MNAEGGLVFVYGTLRQGASNHWRMEGAEFVGEGEVEGLLYRIGWYPGLVLKEGSGTVKGEVYRADAEKMAKLDVFEGCSAGDPEPHEYRRVKTRVRLAGGTQETWVWEFIAPIGEREAIGSGDWLER